MKICIIVQNYFPEDIRVYKEATALKKRGHQITVIALKGEMEKKFEFHEGIAIHRINLKKKRGSIFRYIYEYVAFFLTSFFKLNVLDAQNNFDVIHINNLPDFLVFCAIFQKLKKKKIILDMHEIMPEFYISKYDLDYKNIIVKILLFIEKISIMFADQVITVNELIKEKFLSRNRFKRDIVVVMNTVDENAVGKMEKVNHSGLRFVYHGTITGIYGLDMAIKGFEKAHSICKDMEFHIFGNGPELENMRNLIKKLNMENKVILHGTVSHNHMIKWLSKMDVGILALKKDVFMDLSFSNKLAENVYFKIPVITSDLESTKHYFDSNDVIFFKGGCLNDLKEKMIFAHKNRGKIQEMAERAFGRYQKINWDIMASRYVDAVERN